MKWVDQLAKYTDSTLTFPGCLPITYGNLIDIIRVTSITFPVILQGKWTINMYAAFIKAIDENVSVIVKADTNAETLSPPAGTISLLSSGSEGPSRYINHDLRSLFYFEPLYYNKKVAAALMPTHAAGIEFFFSGILGGNDLTLLDTLSDLKDETPDILHGPPSLLGYLLSSHQRYERVLNRLETFYSGAEALPPIWVKKKNLLNFSFSIQQVYGSTETWSIKTQTHPTKPWLIRIKDGYVPIGTDCLVAEDDGWFRIENERYWIANFFGQKINLFDLEQNILKLKEVTDVVAKRKKTLLGDHILLIVRSLQPSPNLIKQIKASCPLSEDLLEVQFNDGPLVFQKKKRN